jgi:hypothetical protein
MASLDFTKISWAVMKVNRLNEGINGLFDD